MQKRLNRHDQLYGIAKGGIDQSSDYVIGMSRQFLREDPEQRRQRDHCQEVKDKDAPVGPPGGVGPVRERDEYEQQVDLVVQDHLLEGLQRRIVRLGEAVRLLRERGGVPPPFDQGSRFARHSPVSKTRCTPGSPSFALEYLGPLLLTYRPVRMV